MRLDLLVATYRRPLALAGLLDSIGAADHPDSLHVRVTVINNDLQPAGRELHDRLAALPFPGGIIDEPTPGKSHALNMAIGQSTAEYIGIVDDDEELDRGWFQAVEKTLSREELDFIGGRSLPLWAEEPPSWIPPNYPAVLGIADVGVQARDYGPDFPGMLIGGNAVISRAMLSRIGGFCSALGPRKGRRLLSCEDEDLYRRLLDNGARGKYIPELIVYHRIHPERLTRRYHRAWSFWNGASKGVLSRWRTSPFPTVAGVPRYCYGEAVRGAVSWARLLGRRDAERDRFSAELPLWHLLGLLYGRHFPGSATGSGRWAPGEAARPAPGHTL